MTIIGLETNDAKAKVKIFTKFKNNERGPLMFDPAEAKFVPSKHDIFGTKCHILRKI